MTKTKFEDLEVGDIFQAKVVSDFQYEKVTVEYGLVLRKLKTTLTFKHIDLKDEHSLFNTTLNLNGKFYNNDVGGTIIVDEFKNEVCRNHEPQQFKFIRCLGKGLSLIDQTKQALKELK